MNCVKYEESLVGQRTSTILYHEEYLALNMNALAAELSSDNPNADKVHDFREEIWYHRSEIKQLTEALMGFHIIDMTEV